MAIKKKDKDPLGFLPLSYYLLAIVISDKGVCHSTLEFIHFDFLLNLACLHFKTFLSKKLFIYGQTTINN